jgi:hypothetical protein
MKRAIELLVTLAVCAWEFWIGPAMSELWRRDD